MVDTAKKFNKTYPGYYEDAALVVVQVYDTGNGMERLSVWPRSARHNGYTPVFLVPAT